MKKLTPMRKAINELYSLESGSGLATPKQLLDTADKYELDVSELECQYLDEVERLADM